MKRRSRAGSEPVKARRPKAIKPKCSSALKAVRGRSPSTARNQRSPGELEPVFQAMLENAVRICDAKFGNIYRAEADGLRIVATYNTPTVFAEALRNSGPQNPVCLMIKKKALVHVADVAATEAYAEREPIAVAAVELGGTRTLIIVPMLKDNELVGAFPLTRQVVRPFY
jgi:two-component system NtrC family sensor kinase